MILYFCIYNLFVTSLQPQNLVVTGSLPGGRVKLCDFGLSRHLSNIVEVHFVLYLFKNFGFSWFFYYFLLCLSNYRLGSY